MNYSEEDSDVRVDFFASTGKWKYTLKLSMINQFRNISTAGAVKEALKEQACGSYIGLTAVCLEPYHQNAHPVMFTVTE